MNIYTYIPIKNGITDNNANTFYVNIYKFIVPEVCLICIIVPMKHGITDNSAAGFSSVHMYMYI
jgi:hypothetical protein